MYRTKYKQISNCIKELQAKQQQMTQSSQKRLANTVQKLQAKIVETTKTSAHNLQRDQTYLERQIIDLEHEQNTWQTASPQTKREMFVQLVSKDRKYEVSHRRHAFLNYGYSPSGYSSPRKCNTLLTTPTDTLSASTHTFYHSKTAFNNVVQPGSNNAKADSPAANTPTSTSSQMPKSTKHTGSKSGTKDRDHPSPTKPKATWNTAKNTKIWH